MTPAQVTFNANKNTELGGLMIYGEQTVGGPGPGGPGPSGPIQVPTLGEWSLIALSITLAALGLIAVYRRRIAH